MIHHHDWKLVSQDAKGYFEKQPGQLDSALVVPGTVFECKTCPKMILEPMDMRLQTVEVERQ